MIKKIFSILLCFVVLITAFSVPSSAFAVTVASGTYVAYSILIAALAACGVAVASTSVSPGTFQSILDSPGAEDVKALIGATAVLANSGSIYFHWTASEWATFTSWVNGAGFTTGVIQVPTTEYMVADTDFNANIISNYLISPTHSLNPTIGYTLGACTLNVLKLSGNSYWTPIIDLGDGFQIRFISGTGCYNQGTGYYLGSPIVWADNLPYIVLGMCVNSEGRYATTASEIAGATQIYRSQGHFYLNNRKLNYSIENGLLRFYNSQTSFYVNATQDFTKLYTSFAEYFTDVINTGSMVGSIGDDVINPSEGGTNDDIGIDVYPPIAIPFGRNALPLDLGQGESIDIPLDPYLDRQTVSPGDDVIISNPPEWTDTVIDNGPEVVQPEVKINPTTDVPPGTVDVPWSDEQTWPVAYPQTQTGELEEAPPWEEAPTDTQNKPRENTNRMKLSALWLSKFPFCIPWDLKQGVSQLLAPAEAPTFDIPFKNARLGINENIHIDLNEYDTVASVSRWFFSACWVIILIMLTKKMIWK